MTQPTVYRIEFGPAWPVPPITVDFADRNAAHRLVAEHAIPHLRPALTDYGYSPNTAWTLIDRLIAEASAE